MITFALCILVVAMVYIRPGEVVPGLAAWRIPMISLIAGVLSAAGSLLLKPRRSGNLPADLCFAGFCLATVASNPANGRPDGAATAFVELLPLIGVYFVITVAVVTARRLRWFIGALIVLTLFQAAAGIFQYWTGTGAGGVTAVVDGYTSEGETLASASDPKPVRRIQGPGIFNDPNDLAMSLVMVVPFLLSAVLLSDAGWLRRLLSLGILAVVSYALLLTQSRGGFVGAGIMLAAYSYRRFGRATAVVALAVLVVAILAAPGRLSDLSAQEASAQGRVQAWQAGFEMLKSRPVLGVGVGQFMTYHERVAHNSFVHVMAETGLVGLVCFVGMFYWFFVANGPLRNVAGAADSPVARDLWASCIGGLVCACFLSRQYVSVLYMPLALGVARIAIEQAAEQTEAFPRWWDWPLVLAVSFVVVVLTYIAVSTLAA